MLTEARTRGAARCGARGAQLPITYASSSSVYGTNKLIPFSELHQVDSQASLYGATKKANENIAHVYHQARGPLAPGGG